MAISKDAARKTRQAVAIDDLRSTGVLDGTTTSEVINLSMVAEKISFQTTGTLAADISVSLNGTDFIAAGSASVAAIVTYSTHMCKAIKVTRTGGSGKCNIAAR